MQLLRSQRVEQCAVVVRVWRTAHHQADEESTVRECGSMGSETLGGGAGGSNRTRDARDGSAGVSRAWMSKKVGDQLPRPSRRSELKHVHMDNGSIAASVKRLPAPLEAGGKDAELA